MEYTVEELGRKEETDYGKEYRPKRNVKVIKKDGTKEVFNVQKVINAVGKSAYRALTRSRPDPVYGRGKPEDLQLCDREGG